MSDEIRRHAHHIYTVALKERSHDRDPGDMEIPI